MQMQACGSVCWTLVLSGAPPDACGGWQGQWVASRLGTWNQQVLVHVAPRGCVGALDVEALRFETGSV